MSLLEAYNLPFAIALGLIAVLALLQIIGIGDWGGDVDLDIDTDVDAAIGGDIGFAGGVVTLLGVGRVPVFIWLMLFLFLFAAIGLGIQDLADSLTGAPLDAWLAAIFAAIAAVPTTAVLARPIGRLIPREETTAVKLHSLVGRRGTITTGHAARGYPARTRVYDRHGQAHHVMVEPHEDDRRLNEGEQVLLVRREGQIFYAMPVSETILAPLA